MAQVSAGDVESPHHSDKAIGSGRFARRMTASVAPPTAATANRTTEANNISLLLRRTIAKPSQRFLIGCENGRQGYSHGHETHRRTHVLGGGGPPARRFEKCICDGTGPNAQKAGKPGRGWRMTAVVSTCLFSFLWLVASQPLDGHTLRLASEHVSYSRALRTWSPFADLRSTNTQDGRVWRLLEWMDQAAWSVRWGLLPRRPEGSWRGRRPDYRVRVTEEAVHCDSGSA